MNKFLANIGLFTIFVTGAVLLLLFYRAGNGLFGLPSQETTTTRRIVKPADLRTLNPEIKQALEIARTTALDHARSQLEEWHNETMQKVDQNFLDWYFGYWNQQRLGIGYTFNKSKNWVVSFFAEVDENAAEKNSCKRYHASLSAG